MAHHLATRALSEPLRERPDGRNLDAVGDATSLQHRQTNGGPHGADWLAREAKGDSVVRMVNALLSEAIHRRASDVHLEPYADEFRVRFRIDGVLHEVMRPAARLREAITSRLKILARLDIAELRIPLNSPLTFGRFGLKAFVDAQWLSEFDQRLAGYQAHAAAPDAGSRVPLWLRGPLSVERARDILVLVDGGPLMPPKDDAEDYALPIWAGVVPLQHVPMAPQPDPRLAHDLAIPDYLANLSHLGLDK